MRGTHKAPQKIFLVELLGKMAVVCQISVSLHPPDILLSQLCYPTKGLQVNPTPEMCFRERTTLSPTDANSLCRSVPRLDLFRAAQGPQAQGARDTPRWHRTITKQRYPCSQAGTLITHKASFSFIHLL